MRRGLIERAVQAGDSLGRLMMRNYPFFRLGGRGQQGNSYDKTHNVDQTCPAQDNPSSNGEPFDGRGTS